LMCSDRPELPRWEAEEHPSISNRLMTLNSQHICKYRHNCQHSFCLRLLLIW
jgi:hypothetical protein